MFFLVLVISSFKLLNLKTVQFWHLLWKQRLLDRSYSSLHRYRKELPYNMDIDHHELIQHHILLGQMRVHFDLLFQLLRVDRLNQSS